MRMRIEVSPDGKWAVWEVPMSIENEGIRLPTQYQVWTNDEAKQHAPGKYRFETVEEAKRQMQELSRD